MSETTVPPRLQPRPGAPAPDRAGSDLERRAPHGEPRVLAFVREAVLAHDRAGAPPELRTIRAELRGLGAELIVVSAAGVWTVRPDDEPAPLARAGADLTAEISDAAARHGFHPDDDAVFVVDGRGVVRFTHRFEPAERRDRGLWPTLASALAIAGRAAHGRSGQDPRQRVLFTRREWTATCLVVGCATAFLAGCKEQEHRPADRRPPPVQDAPPDIDVTLTINGKPHRLMVDPRTSLLDALRERIGLTGTKKGCDAGQCGACTVLIGGKRVISCLTLAVMAQGRDITTIEGLAREGELHPVQRAFVEHDGLQCGYCTPGQIMSAVALLREGHATSDGEVREQMSGNLCRCGAYSNIVAAIQAARRTRG